MSRRLVDAYSATGGTWARGPERIYGRLAAAMVDYSPVPFTGRSVVDVGAGTGAGGRAAVDAGASSVIAVDAAVGMLLHDASNRVPAVAADATSLPFAGASFDAAIAAFSLNHLRQPGRGLREMFRVVRKGAAVVASAYAADDTHPVKQAVEDALAAAGWTPDEWYAELRNVVTPLLATVEGCRTAIEEADVDAEVHALRVRFDELDPEALVEWRLGMAQHAPFADGLGTEPRRMVVDDALDRLGSSYEPLVRSVLVIAGVKR